MKQFTVSSFKTPFPHAWASVMQHESGTSPAPPNDVFFQSMYSCAPQHCNCLRKDMIFKVTCVDSNKNRLLYDRELIIYHAT